MDEGRMSAVLYARKLRARRVELKSRHQRDQKRYAAAFAKWRVDLTAWLIKNAAARVAAISSKDMTRYTSYNATILEGSPKPPTRPSDETIRKIDSALRRIAITGQAHVSVSNRDIDELFSDAPEEQDE